MPSLGSTSGILCCWDNAVFHASEYVTEQKFIAMKDPWLNSIGLEGLVCVCTPLQMVMRWWYFFESLGQIICHWGCQNISIFGDFNAIMYSE